MNRLLVVCFLFVSFFAYSQQPTVKGWVKDEQGNPLSEVTVTVAEFPKIGAISDKSGKFILKLPNAERFNLKFSHVGYQNLTLPINPLKKRKYIIKLKSKSTELDEVTIEAKQEIDPIDPATKIEAKSAQNLPSAFGDFNQVLLTLPGVSGNNELSSGYNVRGGNFDENLVYVNDIPIYRPFLSTAGRQEGLSFVNPDLVKDIRFFAGGWESKYGDKLSSVLNIAYKIPQKRKGKLTLGMLGGSAYYGDKINEKIQYLIGVRHRDSRYLLNTLPTKGQYFPKYTDAQSFVTIDLTSKKSNQTNRTKLQWLGAISSNRYLTLPASQVTDFGSIQKNLRIETAFRGRESLKYDTYQSGVNLSHRWTNYFLTRFIGSVVQTTEQENYEVEGMYRLCDVDKNTNGSNINTCAEVRAVGTNYRYGRNKLRANIAVAQMKNEMLPTNRLLFEWGFIFENRRIEDRLKTYSFLDSAQFISFDERINNQISLNNNSFSAYAQMKFYSKDSVHNFNLGIRTNYHSLTDQQLYSPRFIYSFYPRWKRPTTFRLSVGRFIQSPFYREFRDSNGKINYSVKAQESIHYILSIQRIMEWWGRPFIFQSEIYHKQLSKVNPYDIDNVRMRYHAVNTAKAYASGMDFRINGEFIKGVQSWFSFGLLQTKEDVATDARKFIRRPTDQRINLAFFFEDHIPNDPSIRISVNGVFGTGFPVGPPKKPALRNIFNGDEYYRLDMGLSKIFTLNKYDWVKSISLKLEVLNALGANNTLSYTWIKDVTGAQLAIPNSLSTRFLNLKFSADF